MHRISLLFLSFLFSISLCYAQVKSYGKTIVELGGEFKVHTHYTFLNLSNVGNQGIVGTERNGAKGYITFMPEATWSGANDHAFVDGYVKSYYEGEFIFPIGDNNQFKPIKLSQSSTQFPTEAAYFGVSASVAVTSPFFGKTSTVLPPDGPYPINIKDKSILLVSSKDYWDIKGTKPTKVTLSWNDQSEIKRLSSGGMKNLTMVGWNGAKWVIIPSKVDGVSIFGSVSSFNLGSITSDSEIDLNDYSVFSIGGTIPDKIELFAQKTNSRKIVKQTQSTNVSIPVDKELMESEDNDILIEHSQTKYGAILQLSKTEYSYIAATGKLGIDTIRSYAFILNKPSAKLTIDTFSQEIVVRYYAPDTSIFLAADNTTTVGKAIGLEIPNTIDYVLHSKKGNQIEIEKGIYQYASSEKNGIDTLLYIANSSYPSIGLNFNDTTRYYIQLHQKNRIQSIQNFISPNGDGIQDFWTLPSTLVEDYPNLYITVANLEGKLIYQHTGKYTEPWNPSGLPLGLYVFYIKLDEKESIKGILRIGQ